MANNTFPEDWRDQPCFLVAVPAPLVPYVGGLLKITEQRGFWATADDYERGYTASLELQGCLMSTCLAELIESNDRLYRMLDAALFGKEYEVITEDPLVVEPGIPAVHEMIYQDGFGLMYQVDRLTQLLDNRIAGTETPLYDDPNGLKQQLQAVIDALAADDTDIADILDQLALIAGLLA